MPTGIALLFLDTCSGLVYDSRVLTARWLLVSF
jgi:hypothetical protein